MLDFCVKLTLRPEAMEAGDVESLRRHGFADRAVHDVAHVASYYNYVNRMADALGVELEAYWRDEALTLTRKEFEELDAGRGDTSLAEPAEREEDQRAEQEGRRGQE